MKLSNNTRNSINQINKIFNENIYIFGYDNLDKLLIKSKKIINYIINNFKVSVIDSKILNNKFTNLIKELLKYADTFQINCSKSVKIFIDNINKDLVTESEISDFLNYNSEEMSKILEIINDNISDYNIKKIINNYDKLILSKFVPYEIHKDILQNLINYKNILVNLDSNKINFKVYYSNIDYNKLCICFVKALYIINLYNLKNLDIEIKLFLSKKEKKIGKHKFLGRDEVNSGLTSFGNIKKIIIYREEEIEKVLLHELVHYLNIDNYIMDKNINNLINCNFNIHENSGINFFEAYTESIAFTTNLISNSILSTIDYKILLDLELKFSILQYSKILKFYRAKKSFFSKSSCVTKTSDWIEKSSILSYYILKLGSIFNLDFFINKYMFSKNFDIIEYYNYIINNLEKIKTVDDITLNKTRSLRMTLYDFIWLY